MWEKTRLVESFPTHRLGRLRIRVSNEAFHPIRLNLLQPHLIEFFLISIERRLLGEPGIANCLPDGVAGAAVVVVVVMVVVVVEEVVVGKWEKRFDVRSPHLRHLSYLASPLRHGLLLALENDMGTIGAIDSPNLQISTSSDQKC